MKQVVRVAVLLIATTFAQVYAGIIKPGDVLNIQVLSHPEFSGQFAVNENGLIDYPLLSEEPVINISTSELMNTLTLRLARHIDNPLVLVTIEEKKEMIITVLGQVLKPGPVRVFEGASVQEAVALAGGPGVSADVERVKVIHKSRPDSPEYFNFQQFLQNGDVELMPVLQNNDIIVVLAQKTSKKVKVIGAVQKPGLFDPTDTMNVFEIIYLAGGPAEKADLSRVRRFSEQGGKSTEEILDIQSYIDKGDMHNIPRVNEGDVIIVYTHWFDWKTVLAVLNNTLLFLVTIQAFTGIIK